MMAELSLNQIRVVGEDFLAGGCVSHVIGGRVSCLQRKEQRIKKADLKKAGFFDQYEILY